ncbi:MAG: cell division protein SepF [Candidatus Limivivens sp.]|nr:cell division protein SepF [Candidatus Limivivens sp.]
MGVLDKFLNAMKLNDDGFDDEEFLDDEIDDYEETRPKKRFFKKLDDDEEEMDDFGYDNVDTVKTEKKPKTSKFQPKQTRQSTPTKQPAASGSKISPIRPKRSGNGMEVCVIKPKSMEDAREITETLLDNCTVLLNMEGLDLDIAQRIIDFSSGSCFAIGGGLQKISSYIFIITPASVDVSGDIQEILNGAFDVPSMHTNY